MNAQNTVPSTTRPIDNIAVASPRQIIINNTVSNNRRHKTEVYSTFYTGQSQTRYSSPERRSSQDIHHSRRSRPKPQVNQAELPRIVRSNTLPTATMCEKHYYKFTTRDGIEKKSQTDLCSQARRRGVACPEPQKFKHPEGERPPPKSTTQYLSANFPPSPPSSDTSFAHSGSDGERAHKRRSGVYVNDQKVAEVGVSRKPSQRERRGSNHVVIVEPPASPRTPPRYVTPSGSPSRSPTYIHEPRSHQYPSYTHGEVRLEVNRPRPDSAVQYNYVPSSPRTRRDSHSQGSGSISDEEARIRRRQRELNAKEAQKQAEETAQRAARAAEAQKDAARRRKVAFDINRQNEEISSRPAAPSAPSPLKKQPASSSKYRRPSVSIQQTDMLSDAMRNVRLETENERRRRDRRAQELREQQARDDEAAQRERLRARMAPQRSNTVGHGSSRRPTVVYDEYR